VNAGLMTTPRPMPSTLVPLAAGSLVILLALPIYAVAGWRLAGWLLAATLWAASQAFGLLLSRLRVGVGEGELGASGVMAFGMMFRAIAVMIVVLAVAVSVPSLALGAALLYGLAYTLELGLSVVAYFSGSPS
jgi:hypothetical protein